MEKGDVFKISNDTGSAIIQYVFNDKDTGYLVRVFAAPNQEVSLEELTKMNEKFVVFFPLGAAKKRKIAIPLGKFSIPDWFYFPKKMRGRNPFGGAKWRIVDLNSGEQEFKDVLSDEELQLSPYGIMNDTMIIEKVNSDWSLLNWR